VDGSPCCILFDDIWLGPQHIYTGKFHSTTFSVSHGDHWPMISDGFHVFGDIIDILMSNCSRPSPSHASPGCGL
jgi:hypothetical protein